MPRRRSDIHRVVQVFEEPTAGGIAAMVNAMAPMLDDGVDLEEVVRAAWRAGVQAHQRQVREGLESALSGFMGPGTVSC